jgi:methylglutamate dehydrogenase subunit D
MGESISALRDHLIPGRLGVPGEAAVTLTDVRRFYLTQFAAWPETVAQVGAIAAQVAGIPEVPGPGRAVTRQCGTLLRVEPLKWWLISEVAAVDQPCLPTETGATLDISSSRCWVRIGGPKAAILLNHFLPLDLRERAFPQGAVVSSAFHHVGVTLWRTQIGFNLLLPRSFAASLCEIMVESAGQYGLEVT